MAFSSGLDALAMKRGLMQALQTREGMDKFAAAAGTFVRLKLRETSWMEKIQPPTQITDDELVPGVTEVTGVEPTGGVGTAGVGETFYVIRSIEPDATAVALNFREDSPARYVNGTRYAIPIGTWASERIQKRDQELAASDYDILKVIEDSSVKEIDRVKDTQYKTYVDAALTSTSKVITATGPITRNHLARLQQPIIKDSLPPFVYLMSDMAFTNLYEWDFTDLGTEVKEVTVNGYKYTSVMGLLYVRSLKTDMFDTYNGDGTLATTQVYCFTSPDFLGHSFLWGDTKVWTDWQANLFSFVTWENGGVGIGNIRGISRLDVTIS